MAMARASAEKTAGTNATDATDTFVDTDSDGLSDAFEDANGLDESRADDANQDTDGDGISNKDEPAGTGE